MQHVWAYTITQRWDTTKTSGLRVWCRAAAERITRAKGILGIRVFETCKIEIRTGGEGALRRSFFVCDGFSWARRREGERRQPPERGAPHTLPRPWEKREQWPVESPQEQEKMLRLLREKGLQTPLSGDTLNQKSGDGRASLRLARTGADENAKASEGRSRKKERGQVLKKLSGFFTGKGEQSRRRARRRKI